MTVFRVMNYVGTLLSHRQRRFLLDRLGLGRIVSRLAAGEFEEVALPGGMTLSINPLLHAHIATDGKLVYEEHVLKAIEDNLGSADTFYDIGANVGVFSIMAAGRVGEAGAVHAFEPEENNLACLRRSLRQSGLANVTLHACAVGAADGSMTFDRRGGAFSGRLVGPGEDAHGASVEVKVRSIDSLIEEGLPPPSLVKIDVEGGEGGVLEGMRRTLERHGPTVLCELHAFNLAGVRQTLDVLTEAGYVCRGLDGEELPSNASGSEMPHHIVAAPASGASRRS